jgi:1,4-alpha-glucan branching enzyme
MFDATEFLQRRRLSVEVARLRRVNSELERQLAAANRALALIAPVIEEAMVFCGDEWFEHESWWREETKPWHTFQQLNQQTALLASDRDAIDVMRTVARAAEGGER